MLKAGINVSQGSFLKYMVSGRRGADSLSAQAGYPIMGLL